MSPSTNRAAYSARSTVDRPVCARNARTVARMRRDVLAGTCSRRRAVGGPMIMALRWSTIAVGSQGPQGARTRSMDGQGETEDAERRQACDGTDEVPAVPTALELGPGLGVVPAHARVGVGHGGEL